MIKTQEIRSLTDFQRNARDFVEHLEKTKLPAVLTVKGKAKVVIQDADAYQKLLDKLDYQEVVNAINESLEDVKVGKTQSLDDFDKKFRKKNKIS